MGQGNSKGAENSAIGDQVRSAIALHVQQYHKGQTPELFTVGNVDFPPWLLAGTAALIVLVAMKKLKLQDAALIGVARLVVVKIIR